MQDQSMISSLGPLAFALKCIVMHSNKERDDKETKQDNDNDDEDEQEKIICWVGTQLTEDVISEFQ